MADPSWPTFIAEAYEYKLKATGRANLVRLANRWPIIPYRSWFRLIAISPSLVPALKNHKSNADDNGDKYQNDQYFQRSGQKCDQRDKRFEQENN